MMEQNNFCCLWSTHEGTQGGKGKRCVTDRQSNNKQTEQQQSPYARDKVFFSPPPLPPMGGATMRIPPPLPRAHTAAAAAKPSSYTPEERAREIRRIVLVESYLADRLDPSLYTRNV